MKIPSFFRTPRYQRFNIIPRYYDPVKEEIEQRTSRIKRELELGKGDVLDEEALYGSRIVGSFKHARSRAKKGGAGMMQMVIVVLLLGLVAGFLYFGNIAFYIFLIVSSVLLYLKVKRII